MFCTTSSEVYTSGKKIACTVTPLAHFGLKRVPQQVYLGRIIHFITAAEGGQYVFATPHGLQLVAHSTQLGEPTAEQHRELDSLEEKAQLAEKILYGGDTLLGELLARVQKMSKK
jgi:hypothetical protein